ncbi:MAG: FAD-dependent thymidylate synthase [Synergistaceae bacterium]|nr:FAD-dependent thymidylate synthase [Synergistaceae bacterium]
MAIFVKLIAATPDAAKIVAAAARMCYSPSGAADILDGLDAEKTASFLNMLAESGHMSPFEHVSFTFAIEGISRVTTHQLVRHRLASYSQQSQRYVGMTGQTCIIPPEIECNPEALSLFKKGIEKAWDCYEKLVEMGITKEDARFILPHGTETRIVVSMNARELHHFFELRLCKRAQWEIRDLARRMLILARNTAPEIFENCGPSCVTRGACAEARPCNDPYPSMEKMLSE